MARLLCTGDLHLGAGSDLGRVPGERLAEQEAVLAQLVELANELDATMVFAGDAWDRRRPTPEELVAFRRPLESVHGEHGYGLRRAGLVIAGNHDREALERATGYDAIETGRHWHYVSTPRVLGIGEVQFACLPWAPPARLVALEASEEEPIRDRDELNRRLADGLVEIARGLFLETDPSRPRVLVAHWSVSGSTASTGIPVELFREPVLDAHALAAIGFDAIILGHIHRPQLVSSSTNGATPPPIFYVGSPMPLNFGEAGHEHVAWMLDVEPGGASGYKIPIASRPLVEVELDGRIPACEAALNGDLDGLVRWLKTFRVTMPPAERETIPGWIVKVRARGTEEQARRWDLAALRRNLETLGAHKVWSIQAEVEKAHAARVVLDETISDEEAFERWLDAEGQAANPAGLPERRDALLERHAGYLEAIV